MNPVHDLLHPLPSGSVQLHGRLGDTLRLSIINRLKQVHYRHLVDPFRFRDERDGKWRCEFWGKIVRSAILSLRGQFDAELAASIEDTVQDLLSTQTADGCISSYPAELQLQDWDLWGRKYVLLGLARYYLHCKQDPAILVAMTRMLDNLMQKVGPQGNNIIQCGHHTGMAATSLLEPIVLVYRITKEQRFLDYARWIADQGGSTVNNIFEAVVHGVPPKELGNGKAYEMMSCFEGLAELYRETGDPRQLQSLQTFYRAVRDHEIFITGVGGLKDTWGEFWDDGKRKQSMFNVGALGETCVTTTWLKLCGQVLRLTGEASIVDEMERTLYNGVLGGVTQDGSWWMHRNPTPLAGPASKIRAGDQIPGYGEDCCLAQGPKALAMAPWLAVMACEEGPVVNLYEPATIRYSHGGCEPFDILIRGDFPRSPEVTIRMLVTAPTEFTVRLRIPQWSQQTAVSIGQELFHGTGGDYLLIKRCWMPDEQIHVQFDLSIRAIRAYDESPRVALVRGPIVLAQDSRLGAVGAPVTMAPDQTIPVQSVKTSGAILDQYKLAQGMTVCDYASAGNEFSEYNTLCVWIPVPHE